MGYDPPALGGYHSPNKKGRKKAKSDWLGLAVLRYPHTLQMSKRGLPLDISERFF